jgi:hypothetical protein
VSCYLGIADCSAVGSRISTPMACFSNSNCSGRHELWQWHCLAPACSRVPLQRFRNGEFANPTALVRHQHRQVSVLHDVAGGAAKDHLPQPAAREAFASDFDKALVAELGKSLRADADPACQGNRDCRDPAPGARPPPASAPGVENPDHPALDRRRNAASNASLEQGFGSRGWLANAGGSLTSRP